jgi:hypothetical protein
VLRAGDMVMRVNGHSIERPEQFTNVWESMRTSGELVLDIRREGRDSRVRYLVTDEAPAAPSEQAAPETSSPPPPAQPSAPPAPSEPAASELPSK